MLSCSAAQPAAQHAEDDSGHDQFGCPSLSQLVKDKLKEHIWTIPFAFDRSYCPICWP